MNYYLLFSLLALGIINVSLTLHYFIQYSKAAKRLIVCQTYRYKYRKELVTILNNERVVTMIDNEIKQYVDKNNLEQ